MRNIKYILLGLLTMIAACSQDKDDPAYTPFDVPRQHTFNITTRATGDALNPIADVERIHDYRIVFADAYNKVAAVIEKNGLNAEQDQFTTSLAEGTYTVYSFANVATNSDATWPTFATATLAVGSDVPDDIKNNTALLLTVNGTSGNLPMTGRQTVTVVEGENQPFSIELVRAQAKLQLDFHNASSEALTISSYTIEPLTANTAGVSLFEPTTIAAPAVTEALTVTKDIALATTGATATDYCYLNETRTSITPEDDEYLLRFAVKRGSSTAEYRYALTDATTLSGGIRRGDWLKIPIHLTDYLLRIDALSYVPIGGYPAHTVTTDADHTARFSTGGTMVIGCYLRKYGTSTWMRLDDARVKTYSIATTDATPNIFTTPPALNSAGEIIGILSDSHTGMATVTLSVTIEEGSFTATFAYHIYIIRE